MNSVSRHQELLVVMRNLHVSFGRQPVLRDINLEFRCGQIVVVVGESGCGKTVLLKSIVGLVKHTRGECLFDGRNLAELGDEEVARERMRMGFVFQGAALFDSMTIAQNVAFPLRQHTKKTPNEISEIVQARLADVGLSESVLTKKPAMLSGGMRKRVALARALALSPELMLYDEPTTGLDPIMSDVINELILRTHESHSVTSIIVTHDMNTARKVANRVVMLFPLSRLGATEAQVVFDGPPEKLDHSNDKRVRQFVRGEAGERLMEMPQHDRML